jgi:hypothetical protein
MRAIKIFAIFIAQKNAFDRSSLRMYIRFGAVVFEETPLNNSEERAVVWKASCNKI